MSNEDYEKQAGFETYPAESSTDDLPENLRKASKWGPLAKLRAFENALDRKLGVESHGIARVLPEDRDPTWSKWTNQAVMALLWASGTMNLSCFATGFLGWEFGMSLSQTIIVIIFATLLGSAVTGFCATMGPGMGLRQVSIARYSMGWWPAKVIAFLNVVEQLGWSSVGSITGGLALSAVSDGKIGSALGVVIVAVCGFILSFIGLRAVMTYEKYAWAVFFIIFMIMYGETASSADIHTGTELTGATYSGTVLSLFAIIYGSSASWCSIVADYYVQYPVNTSKLKVFTLTTLGITIPTCIPMILGACVASAMNYNEEWKDVYENQGVGFLIQTILHPLGFAKFLLVILVLSGIGMNCIAMYSAGLSVQQFARPLSIIPRFFWTSIIFVGIILIGLAGRDKLLTVLQNFLSLLGYWNTSFFVIVFSEHYFFRNGRKGYQDYDLDAWNDRSRMPIGIAGGLAFAAGIVGFILGMVETWYTGVLAAKIGDYGGDIGNELAFAFTLIVYFPARILELKWTGR